MEDLRDRTKLSKTVIEIMKNHGCLNGLPGNNQLSLANLHEYVNNDIIFQA